MRHLLIFSALAILLAGAYFWTRVRTAPVTGRVVMHDVEGREVAGSIAKVSWYPAEVVDQHLGSWLDIYEGWHRDNDLEMRAARNEWNQKVASRDEAARILRVAENANSADLEICRARHREAAADAEDALQRLERLGSGADQTCDPARFISGLPAPSIELAVNGDGRFAGEVPHGIAGYLVASVEQGGEGRKERLVWLRLAPEEVQEFRFSNVNILTLESLAATARKAAGRKGAQSSPVIRSRPSLNPPR